MTKFNDGDNRFFNLPAPPSNIEEALKYINREVPAIISFPFWAVRTTFVINAVQR